MCTLVVMFVREVDAVVRDCRRPTQAPSRMVCGRMRIGAGGEVMAVERICRMLEDTNGVRWVYIWKGQESITKGENLNIRGQSVQAGRQNSGAMVIVGPRTVLVKTIIIIVTRKDEG